MSRKTSSLAINTQQDHHTEEDVEALVKDYLSQIRLSNKLLRKLQQLSAEKKELTESLCEEPISAEELDSRSTEFYQVKFDEVSKLWWHLTKDCVTKRRKLSEIIFYYLIRDEELDICVKATVCMLWETLQKSESWHGHFEKFYPLLPKTWYSLFLHGLSKEETFQMIYSGLGNYPSAMTWLIKRKPSLFFMKKSNSLVEILSKSIPYNSLHQMLMSVRDEYGRTHLFYSYCGQTYSKLYADHLEDLYRLLLIKDQYGHTALHFNFTPIIETFFKTCTPHQLDVLCNLLSLQNNSGKTPMFGTPDASCTLLADLYTNHAEKLYNILAIQDNLKETAIFRSMSSFKHVLLKTYTSNLNQRHQLINLLRTTDEKGQTYLFSDQYHGNHFNQLDLYEEIFNGKIPELYDMLSIQDTNGQTILFHPTKMLEMADLLKNTYSPTNLPKLIALLSVQDNTGRTHLFFQSTIPTILYADWFAEHTDELCVILSIQDNTGQTAIHTNHWEICYVLTRLYSFKHREKFRNVLEIKDNRNKTALETVGDEGEGLRELVHIVKNNCYLLEASPAVLVFYFTKKRPWGKEEAEELFGAISLNHARIEPDKREYEIIRLIRQTVDKKPSALIVFILSHGKVGSIFDFDDEPVSLSSIEKAMCENWKVEGRPKILITQCCQIGQESNSTPPYVPTHGHFFAAMSCVSGQPSIRRLFTSKLAQRIKSADPLGNTVEPITVTMAGISKEIEKEDHPQTPIVMSTLKADFALIKSLRRHKRV